MKGIKNLLGGLLLVIMLIILDREILGREKPVSKKKEAYVWAWVCILALALLGLLNKCALAQFPEREYVKAQAEAIPWPWLSPTPLGMAAANTTCTNSNKPVILYDPRIVPGSDDWNEIISHENVHVRQYKAYKGGCHALFLASQGPKGIKTFILNEAEAYCENHHGDIRSFAPKLAEGLFVGYGQRYGLTEKEVRDLIVEKCYFWAGGLHASG